VMSVSAIEFRFLLELAFANGWRPRGTQPAWWIGPNGDPIEGYGDAGGRYDCARGQIMGDDDANDIRSCLSRALVDPLGRLNSRGRRLVEDFVYFLDRGAFAIA